MELIRPTANNHPPNPTGDRMNRIVSLPRNPRAPNREELVRTKRFSSKTNLAAGQNWFGRSAF
jgi:hypothetical protein